MEPFLSKSGSKHKTARTFLSPESLEFGPYSINVWRGDGHPLKLRLVSRADLTT